MKIAIIPKQSNIEWSMKRLFMDRDTLLRRYAMQERDIDRMAASEKRQHESIERIISMFPGADVLSLEAFNKEKAKQYDLVASVGGDNMFQMVAHYLEETPIIGINSDSVTSTGALLYFDPDTIAQSVKKILEGRFGHEEWTRAEADINGKLIEDARGLFCIYNTEGDMMTRYKLKLNGAEEEQKSTGIIVSTGAGSTGWYKSSGIYLPMIRSGRYPAPASKFSPSDRSLKTITRETHGGEECDYKMLNLEIRQGEELELIYWSPDNAKVSSDSVIRYVISEGDRIRFRVSPRLFRVVTPEKIYR
jgi:NAD kinase